MGVSFKGYAEIARLLIGRGAALNLQNGKGGTALHLADQQGNDEAWALLGGAPLEA